MRVTVGTLGALCLVVAVAVGQPPRERAAQLKPPVALPASEAPPVARGAEPSLAFGGTPVEKRSAPPSGPSWLTGADPNLLPAGGATAKTGGAKQLTPAPGTKDPEPSFRDRVRNAMPSFGTKDAPPPNPLPDQLTKKPVPPAKTVAEPVQPTAATAFKAVSGTGTPVYAGPPAYRWYGWGTVTPGANPAAPSGQYPRASAAWYAVTGATPGAFPVPVTSGGQPLPGVEPPTYGIGRSSVPPASAPVAPISGAVSGNYVPPPVSSLPPAARMVPQTEPKLQPSPSAFVPPPAFVPPTVPAPKPTLPPLPPTISVPTIAEPPALKPVTVAPTAIPALPPVSKPAETAAAVPPPASLVPSVEPLAPVVPAARETVAPTEPETTEPRPLPTTSTVRDETNWSRAAEPAPPQPGTWVPANGHAPLPTRAPTEPAWNQSRGAAPPVVRGQVNETRADPVAELLKQVCAGRADGLEVRYVGTKKLVVCFEIRGRAGAEKLVADISARPELTAYQIDFCVVVK